MIKRDVITDIRKIKTSFIGGFTMRQIFCFLPMIIIIILFAVFLPIEDIFIRIVVGMLVGSPLLAIGIPINIYGKPFEKGILLLINDLFLSPSVKKVKATFSNEPELTAKEFKKEQKRQKKIKKASRKYKASSEEFTFLK